MVWSKVRATCDVGMLIFGWVFAIIFVVVVVAAGGLFAGRNRVDVAPVELAAGVERLESRIRSYEIERESMLCKVKMKLW